MARQKIINLHNNGVDNAKPGKDYIMDGEIAVNGYAGNEKLWIKNGGGTVVDFPRKSKNVVGASPSAIIDEAATNGNVYLNHIENKEITSHHKIIGTGDTSVTSDSSGNITINSNYVHPSRPKSGDKVPETNGGGTGVTRFVEDVYYDKTGHVACVKHGTIPGITVVDDGSGNAVTDVTASGHTITLTRGKTFLTEHQPLTGYVKKTGDSMSGSLTFPNNSHGIKGTLTNSNSDWMLYMDNSNRVHLGYNGRETFTDGAITVNGNIATNFDISGRKLSLSSYIDFGDYGARIDSDVKDTFRTSVFGISTNGSRFRTVRTDVTVENFSTIYGTGIAWATGDTHGFLNVSYSGGDAFIGGGASNKLLWRNKLWHNGNFDPSAKSNVGHTHDRILNKEYGAKIDSTGHLLPVLGNEHIGAENNPWDSAYIKQIDGKITNAGYSDVAGVANSMKEANLSWGGGNYVAGFGCIDAAMIPELGANRLEFAKPEGVVIEYSNDGGSTWKDYGAGEATKLGLTSSGTALYIGKYSTSPSTAKDKLRITFKTGEAGIYTALNKFAIYISTEGGSGCTCTIQKALQSTPENYSTVVDKQSIGGWSGWNIINVPSITTYGNTASSQYGRIRFIFESNGGGSQYKGLIVYKIMGFGGQGWTTPSNMAENGHLYSYNHNQRAFFPEYVSASGFIKSGYGDSYVLKAGGGAELESSLSVDNAAYIGSNHLCGKLSTGDFGTTSSDIYLGASAYPWSNAYITMMHGTATHAKNFIDTGGRSFNLKYTGTGDGESAASYLACFSNDGKSISCIQPGKLSVKYSTDADTVDGLHAHTGRNNEANKVVRTDGNGYIQCGYINSGSGDEQNNSNPSFVWGTNGSDSYLRTYKTSALEVSYSKTSTQSSFLTHDETANKSYVMQYLQTCNQTPGNDLPSEDWYHVLKFNHGTGDTYYKRNLALDFHSNRIKTNYATSNGKWKGSWETLAFLSDIPSVPSKLPANGGNADTVDNEHAAAFVHVAGDSMTGDLTFPNQSNGVKGKLTNGNSDWMLFMDSSNRTHLSYNGRSAYIDGSTTVNGSLSATGVYDTSDERLKNFKDDIEVDFNLLKKIPKKYFTWKDDGMGKEMQIGTSAQEVQKIYPELVHENEEGTLSVSYAKLSMVALKAVDELHDKNEELNARVQELEWENRRFKEELEIIKKKLGL